MIYGLWICGIVLMWLLVTDQCIFDIWYCILVYLRYHMRLTCSGLNFRLPLVSVYFRSYLPVFVLPFIPLPFSLQVVRLPLPFSSKNMKMKTIERFSVCFRPFSTLLLLADTVLRGASLDVRHGVEGSEWIDQHRMMTIVIF